MQRGRVLNLSKFQILDFLKANAYTLICFLFLVLGVSLGLIFFNDFEIITSFLKTFFSDFIDLRQSCKFLEIVLASFLKSLLLFLFIFVSGTTLFGVVTLPLTVCLCGFFYGSAVAYLYATFALKGVAFNAVIFMPSSLVLIIFVVFASRLAMKFSIQIARLTLPNTMQSNLFLQFKEYSINFLLLSLGSLSAAMLDGITAVSMLRFFEF